MSKRDTQEWLHEHCRASVHEAVGSGAPVDANGKWLHHPRTAAPSGRPRRHRSPHWRTPNSTSCS